MTLSVMLIETTFWINITFAKFKCHDLLSWKMKAEIAMIDRASVDKSLQVGRH